MQRVSSGLRSIPNPNRKRSEPSRRIAVAEWTREADGAIPAPAEPHRRVGNGGRSSIMLTSVIPVLGAPAAIPDQVVTLTFSPVWTAVLFAVALTLTCGAMWLLRNVERRSRTVKRDRATVTPLYPRPGRPAVAGHHAA